MSPFELILAEAANFPVTVLCALLGVSTSGYYAFMSRGRSSRRDTDERLTTKIRAVHARTRGVYGSRRMVAELGEPAGRNHIARLMRENDLLARAPRRFRTTTDSKHSAPIAPNLLAQDFTTNAPNRVWVGDITYAGPLRAGATSRRCSTSSDAASWAGPSPTTCARSCHSGRCSGLWRLAALRLA